MLHNTRRIACALAFALAAAPLAADEKPADAQAPAADQKPAEAQAPAAAGQQQPAQPQQQAGQPRQQQAPWVSTTSICGAWQVVCRVGGGPCAMRQIGKTKEGKQALEVSIRKVEPQQTQQGTVESVIDVRVPLGVLLREGLTIQIDKANPQKGAFGICLRDGCILREPLPNSMISAMKKGAMAKMTFVLPGGPVEAEVSLTGFTASYNALEAPKKN